MLQIHEEILAEYRILTLSGRFDFYGIQAFKTAINNTDTECMTHLVVDLSQVPFIDSASLGALVVAQKRLSQSHRSICLVVDPDSAVGQVMSHASIQKLLPTFTKKDDAIASLPIAVPQP